MQYDKRGKKKRFTKLARWWHYNGGFVIMITIAVVLVSVIGFNMRSDALRRDRDEKVKAARVLAQTWIEDDEAAKAARATEKADAEKAESEAAIHEQWLKDSYSMGKIWASRFKATNEECDARIGTKAVEVEGWAQREWLQGCLEEAANSQSS
jgi:inorganic pyrophosphatase